MSTAGLLLAAATPASASKRFDAVHTCLTQAISEFPDASISEAHRSRELSYRACMARFGQPAAWIPIGSGQSRLDAMKRAEGNRLRLSSMKRGAVVAAWLLCGAAAEAGPSTCLRELGTTDITLIKSILQLRGVEHAAEDQRCAAYRQHVATVSKVREVFERCLAGAKRDVDLRPLEGALDDADGVMARICDR
jgi:hypothetical protein